MLVVACAAAGALGLGPGRLPPPAPLRRRRIPVRRDRLLVRRPLRARHARRSSSARGRGAGRALDAREAGGGRRTCRSRGPPSLVPDGHPRALSVGRGPGGATVVVSRGLLGALPPAELEGVLSHELAHVVPPATCSTQTLAVARGSDAASSCPGSAAGWRGRCCSSSARLPRRSCTRSCRRGASSPPTGTRPASARSPHGLAGRAPAPRPGQRAAPRVPVPVPQRPPLLRRRPVRANRRRGAVRHPPASRRARGATQSARPRGWPESLRAA